MYCCSETLNDFLTKRNIAVNSTEWARKSMYARCLYICLLLCYFPLFLVGLIGLGYKGVTLKIKQFLGKDQREGRLGELSKKHKVRDMEEVSDEDKLDFIVNRGLGYLIRQRFWTPREFALLLLGEQKIKLISDGQLAYVVLYTVFGRSVTWNDERQMFHFTMNGLGDLSLFDGYHYDAREILISADAKKIIIKMDEGEEFHSDCDPDERPNYDLAKLHAQICLSYVGPGLSHNDVHFVLPSAMAVMSKKHYLHRDGILYKLLSPHFRFTEMINYQALKVQKATSNKDSWSDALFFHWEPFPVTKEIFSESITKKCREIYFEKGSGEPDGETDFNLSDDEDAPDANGQEVPQKGDTSCSKPKAKGLSLKRTHKIFPPEFVTDKNMRKVPYLNFLTRYYTVIRRYIEDLSPYIDKKEWKTLSTEVAKCVPRFDKVNMVDAIASYILKVGVSHYCDHATYTKYFAYPYACMAMRKPFKRMDSEEAWQSDDPVSLNIKQRDVFRTRAFLNIFVDFIQNPRCNLFLLDTEYGFDETPPQLAEEKFKKNLRRLDEKLKMQARPVHLPEPEDGEVRAEGMQLAPLAEIVRTVCY